MQDATLKIMYNYKNVLPLEKKSRVKTLRTRQRKIN